jgi:acetoin utilization protein AcuB
MLLRRPSPGEGKDLASVRGRRFEQEATVQLQEIMNRQVRTIRPDASIEEARDEMRRYDVRHLVVVDGGRVVGVVSERDLGGRKPEVVARAGTVAEVMTPHVVSAKPTTTVRQAANLLRGHLIGFLPVMDEGRLVGVISTADLLDLIGRGTERPRRRVARPTLRHKPALTRVGRRS